MKHCGTAYFEYFNWDFYVQDYFQAMFRLQPLIRLDRALMIFVELQTRHGTERVTSGAWRSIFDVYIRNRMISIVGDESVRDLKWIGHELKPSERWMDREVATVMDETKDRETMSQRLARVNARASSNQQPASSNQQPASSPVPHEAP